ncbi:endonuclease domain-containing protein [Saccharothrix hoggarensis]|uniref:Endonuclease domain-containing protein n=1 Tax=Saccharothrix hoggarensis TaxID=913853 RepID=A0ABW3QK48_9PSEU
MAAHDPRDADSRSAWDALPEQRRTVLLRRLGPRLGEQGVRDRVAGAAQSTCRWRWMRVHLGDPWAVPGDDGLFHLAVGDVVVCSRVSPERTTTTLSDTCHPRRRRFYRLAGSTGPGAGIRTVDWTVTFVGAPVPPNDVPPGSRCVYPSGRSDWPPYVDNRTALGRIRRTLIDLSAGRCQACGLRIGVAVDHDHDTGRVRGLLCSHCNAHVDTCPHVDGCPWADYLAAPPAAPLDLFYPRHDRRLRPRRPRSDR